MKFIWMDDLTAVSKGYAGIPEPIEDGPIADDPTALVLMPGLAFDPQGHRFYNNSKLVMYRYDSDEIYYEIPVQ